nr:LysR substrate-binding domain-containing protein [uncultured Holophaga sp.]
MELRQLRYFIAVAEHLHFRRASEVMHIAQPSLSQQIHQLEEELGAVLFDRNQRKVTLTPAGVVFYQKAKTLLRDAERALEDTRRVALGHAGLLSLSFITTAALEVLPSTVKEFQSLNPSVEIKVLESAPKEQFTALYERAVDIALVIAKVEDPVFDTLTLARYSIMAAVPDNHPLASQASVSLKDLSTEVLIVPEKHPFPGLHALIHFSFQLAGLEPARELNIRLLHTGLLLVGSGLGVSLIPEVFSRFQTPGVVYVPLDPPMPPVEISAVWRRDGVSPLLQRYLEVLREYANQNPRTQNPI